MAAIVKDDRRLYDILCRSVKINKHAHTKVGFQRKDGKKEKKNDVLVVDVAIANEFGTSKIDARSFMRTYFEENKERLAKIGGNMYTDVLLGKLDVKKGLSMLGEYAKAGVQKKIDDIDFPPNAPSTIKKKGSSKPLIDTGQMRQSITHEEVLGES
jgi:hypothetical protein